MKFIDDLFELIRGDEFDTRSTAERLNSNYSGLELQGLTPANAAETTANPSLDHSNGKEIEEPNTPFSDMTIDLSDDRDFDWDELEDDTNTGVNAHRSHSHTPMPPAGSDHCMQFNRHRLQPLLLTPILPILLSLFHLGTIEFVSL